MPVLVNPGCDTVGANVTTDPRLVLGLSTSRTIVPVGKTATLTADLTHNSNGDNTSGSGNLPDGTPASFNIHSGGGTLSPCATSTTSGQAECTFSPGAAAETSNVFVTVDGQTEAIYLHDGQETPNLSWANPSDITYGTLLSATQLDASSDTAGTFAYNHQPVLS